MNTAINLVNNLDTPFVLMDSEEFEKLLAAANLTKPEFAELSGVSMAAVHKWKREGKYPGWTLGWLEGFANTKKLKDIQDTWETLNNKIN
jgi:hypothetical protein